MTGFRIARGGAQALYGVCADLITLGKVIGGGLPVGAFGGRADVMNHIAPAGPVYQAGTLSGNPLATTAGSRLAEYPRRRLLQPTGVANQGPRGRAQRDRRQSQCSGTDQQRLRHVQHVLHIRQPGCILRGTSHAAMSRATTASFTRCSTPASTSLHPHSNPHSFPASHTDAEIDATLAAADRAFSQLD